MSLMIVAAMLAVTALTPGTAAATPAAGPAEVEFLQRLNQERVGAGLAPLVSDGAIVPIAREWSSRMAAEARLYHRPDLADQVNRRVTTQWQRLGENVGRGADVPRLHQAFMDSPGHRANVLGDFNRVGVGVVVSGSTVWVTFNFLKGPAIAGTAAAAPPSGDFWIATAAGEVHSFGTAPFHGSLGGQRLNQPIVGIAATPSRKGYWLVARDGGIFTFGDAGFFGSTGAMRLNQPIVGMAPSPTGRGYWLVATDGGIFAFGDAAFHGSTGAIRLNQPILAMAPTRTGRGYWLTASDGGIFAFGDAVFHGSTGGRALAAPVTAMAASPSGGGYWLVGRDGGVHTFGDAGFYGSAGSRPVTGDIAGIAVTSTGRGYRLVARDGQVHAFGDAGSASSGPLGLANPVVSLALA